MVDDDGDATSRKEGRYNTQKNLLYTTTTGNSSAVYNLFGHIKRKLLGKGKRPPRHHSFFYLLELFVIERASSFSIQSFNLVNGLFGHLLHFFFFFPSFSITLLL